MSHSTCRAWTLYCCAFVVSVLVALGASAEPLPAKLTAAEMREDLAYLRDTWSHEDRSFSAANRERFELEVESVAANVDGLTSQQLALEVARLAAIADNGHTVSSIPAMPALPVRLWPFDDGLFVVSAHPKHADLIGARIVRIGEVCVEEAMRRISMFLPGNDEHRRIEAPRFLTNPQALQRAGIVTRADRVAFTVVDRQGRERRLHLDTSLNVEPVTDDTWTVLVPAKLDAEHRWPHVLDSVPSPPRAYASVDDLSYEWLSTAPRMLYVRMDQIGSDDDVRLDMKLLDMTVKELVPQPPDAVIVDLRYNMGGNFLYTILFAQMLPELVAPHGKIVVLTGPVTFSAALVTASMLKIHGGERVTFVGDHMGDRDQFWAEGRNLELPHSHLPVRLSDYYHDWSQPCRDSTCLWATRIFGPEHRLSLEPDVRVATTFSDYSIGVDRVLQRAIELSKQAQAE